MTQDMDLKGLDYNTQRERLVLPEYGREVQRMVEHAVSLPDRDERLRCAEAIVSIMARMFPENKNGEDYERKLWDHLAIMSGFKLDIDYPYDVSQAESIIKRPAPMDYPMRKIPVRHYGTLVFELLEKLKVMEPGEERDELVRLTANQMKRDLVAWSHGSCDNEKVASDLASLTDGKIQLDLDKFKFDRIVETPPNTKNKKKK